MASSDVRPLPTITPTHHGGYVRVTAGLAIVCMLVFLFIRLVARRPWEKLFGFDDWVALTASICALCQSIVVLFSLNSGLGTVGAELSPDQRDKTLKLLYASDLLFVPTIFVGELAVALFFLRLSGPNRTFFHWTARLISGASILAAVTSFLTMAIRIESGLETWKIIVVGHDTILYRWIAVGVMSIIIEALLIICPAWLFWTLQMSLDKKLECSLYFALRFPTMILTIVRLVSLANASKGKDPTFDMTMPAIYTQLEMNFSVLAATIPILRNPLKQLNTGYLNATLEQTGPPSSSAAATVKGSSSNGDQSYKMSDGLYTVNGISCRRSEAIAETGSNSPEGGQSVRSDRSNGILVKRTVEWSYGECN